MSVDIAWDTFTAGPDGAALGETIRDFMHDKFQTITLPRFIKAVHVHSFEFGSIPPQIEIKDISDPLPDFYEDDGDEEQSEEGDVEDARPDATNAGPHQYTPTAELSADSLSSLNVPEARGQSATHPVNTRIDRAEKQTTQSFLARPGLRSDYNSYFGLQDRDFSRGRPPGIPGGTSNLSYFHLPVGGLSGAQTPLAAVASGTPFSSGPWHHDLHQPLPPRYNSGHESNLHARPSTADSLPSPDVGSPFDPSSPASRPVTYPVAEKVSDDLTLEDLSNSATAKEDSPNPMDLQVVARVNYDGDVRMTLTAEILLDYPMPSFVGIPLKLSVTGITFDGVAILAYIKRRMHFCFLDPEDAQTLVGDQMDAAPQDDSKPRGEARSSTLGGLLREIRVESEIGKREDGKQVLKNVGKVEKFILEQVRRIFEDEFVFPSFWTFLV